MPSDFLQNFVRDLVGIIFGVGGLAYIYGVSDASRPAGIGCALMSWFTRQIFVAFGFTAIPAAFFGTLVASLYAEIMARKLKRPATSFLVMGLLPLVPGGSIYQAMLELTNGNDSAALANAREALGLAVAMAFGVVIVTSFFKIKPAMQ